MAGRLCRSARGLSYFIPEIQTRRTASVKHLATISQRPHGVPVAATDERPHFPGCRAKFTKRMEFIIPNTQDGIPIYHVLDTEGNIVDPDHDPKLGKNMVTRMYQTMAMTATADQFLCDAQNQGGFSLYLPNFGEEATHVGSAAAVNEKDLVFAQYREAGVLLWRGYPVTGFVNQCFGTCDDIGKGRMMPCSYGSPEHSFMTISYPLCTQMPQATGAAYAYKRAQNGLCVICYFGEGSASEGDAHPALNFACTLECPIIFFCRNNGYAISTPSDEQYKGDGIVARGIAYGMHSIRVDGNDVFAVYNAVKAAREIAVSQHKPVLVEAMTYRVGHHSTAVDSTLYRSPDEVSYWANEGHPIHRLQMYMKNQGWWSDAEEEAFIAECQEQIMSAIEKAYEMKRPNPECLFTDVYDKMPKRLAKQRDQTKLHVMKYKDKYPLDAHEEWE